MPKFNTMFDVAFSIDHDCDDPYDIPVADLIEAMLQRVNELKAMAAGDAMDAFGACDTYEIPRESNSPGLYAVQYGDGSRTAGMSYDDACEISDQTDGLVVKLEEDSDE